MEGIKELLFKMADDALVIGHRNSEWTGLGPTLEEDIAFSSIAQDKIGHALQLYTILHEEYGEKEPDLLAFVKEAGDFKCCQYVELPIGEYNFSLIRHYLFDHAEYHRYQMLSESSVEKLANLSNKIKGEIKYHLLHADTWVSQLADGSDESHQLLQDSIDESYPYALGIFEESPFEEEIIKEKIFEGENILKERWLSEIVPFLEKAGFTIPEVTEADIKFGGRRGEHTEYLQPLAEEMGEVIRTNSSATW